jgi:choline monooxygenase
MLNVCRHRGTRLCLTPAEDVSSIRCPYHGWTYGLDGALRGCTDLPDGTNFRRADFPLLRANVEVWEGFLMVNFDPNAASFASRCTEIDRWGGDRYRMGDHVTTHRWKFRVPCNWKTYVDNYAEAYHVPFVHYATFEQVSPLKTWVDMPDVSDEPWVLMMGRVPDLTMSNTGKPLLPVHADLTGVPEEFRGMPVWLGYPSLMVIIAVDCFLYYVAIPRGPEECDVLLRLCFPKAVVQGYEAGDPAIRAAVDEYAANTHAFILEDNKVSALQQVALRSRHAVPGPFHPTREPLLWKFQNWIARTAYVDEGAR